MDIKKMRATAMRNYCNGGDTIVECMDDKQCQEFIDGFKHLDESGQEKALMAFIREGYSITMEHKAAANYFSGEPIHDLGKGWY